MPEVVLDLPGADAVAVAVPEEGLKADPDTRERSASVNKDSTSHRKKKKSMVEAKSDARTYFSGKKVEAIVNVLMIDLLREMPEHPAQWCTTFFTRHDNLEQLIENYTEKAAKFTLTDEMRLWAAEWEVAQLVNELLTSIIEERPPEPDSYAGTWFRWKKNAPKKQPLPEGWKPQPL